MTEVLYKQVCVTCGSEDVLCDAYVKWNVAAQLWALQNLFDKGAYCNACDGETRINKVEISRVGGSAPS